MVSSVSPSAVGSKVSHSWYSRQLAAVVAVAGAKTIPRHANCAPQISTAPSHHSKHSPHVAFCPGSDCAYGRPAHFSDVLAKKSAGGSAYEHGSPMPCTLSSTYSHASHSGSGGDGGAPGGAGGGTTGGGDGGGGEG